MRVECIGQPSLFSKTERTGGYEDTDLLRLGRRQVRAEPGSFANQSRKTGYARPTAKQRCKGVTEHVRIPGHPRLAEILLRCDNTDGYLDSTRHAERCVRMSVTQGDASKPPTVVPAYSVTRTVETCNIIV
jgi:hypothetical protein